MRMMATAALVVALAGVATVRAEDKVDPTGTWKWEVERNGQKREQSFKLKLEGDKLTGAMLGRNNQETAIENATFKDGVVTFSVTRERQGNKFTTKYSGKIEGDTFKGKIETDRDGQVRARDFEAKRSKD